MGAEVVVVYVHVCKKPDSLGHIQRKTTCRDGNKIGGAADSLHFLSPGPRSDYVLRQKQPPGWQGGRVVTAHDQSHSSGTYHSRHCGMVVWWYGMYLL